MFSERRGRRSLHPNIQQIDKPEFDAVLSVLNYALSGGLLTDDESLR